MIYNQKEIINSLKWCVIVAGIVFVLSLPSVHTLLVVTAACWLTKELAGMFISFITDDTEMRFIFTWGMTIVVFIHLIPKLITLATTTEGWMPVWFFTW